MYSNRKYSINIFDLIVKILFGVLFIFILIWLFKRNVPNMVPFYNNVFRENIKHMQEAGESYFTDDKMPKEVGQTVKITLSEMFDKKLVLPFVDKNGNSCNQYESYVSITKEVDETYSLKTNLVCNDEEDYLIKVLGCHTYCKNNDCSKTCKIEKLTSYQYKKQVTTTSTKYSCDSGYKLDGKYCFRTVLDDSKSAKVTTVSTKKIEKPAISTVVSGTKELVETNKEKQKEYVNKITTVTPGEPIYETVSYACEKQKTEYRTEYRTEYKTKYKTQYKTEKRCSTTYVQQAYACNCTGGVSGGVPYTTCSTCYSSVPVESCQNVSVPYQVPYQEAQKVPYQVPYQVTYTDTCYKQEESKGPDKVTYSCPSNTIKEGSGENLKCYKLSYKYSCPSNSNHSEGTGANLRCYIIKEGKVTYKCDDSSYTLNGKMCYKYVDEESTEYKCNGDYKLEGTVCNKYKTEKVKANAKKVTNKSYKYQWSTKSSISGWTKTGKTKIINGEEICE